jgi:hypothetical protein
MNGRFGEAPSRSNSAGRRIASRPAISRQGVIWAAAIRSQMISARGLASEHGRRWINEAPAVRLSQADRLRPSGTDIDAFAAYDLNPHLIEVLDHRSPVVRRWRAAFHRAPAPMG